jgi:hypothetical protein
MMVGALLTKCGCEVCATSLPELPPEYTELVKGFCGTTDLYYQNEDGLSNTGPVPIKLAIVGGNGFRCTNDFIINYGSTGPFPLDPNFLNWSPTTLGVEDYLLIYGIYSKTQGSVTWNLVNETIQSTTGGYARPSTATILVTGGIPIKRNVYQFNLSGSGPTGANNEPDFYYEDFSEPVDCCCGCTIDPLCAPCPIKTYASVTGGTFFVSRTITSGKFDQTEYGTLYLRYPGKINSTYYAFTINLADNPTNNAKTWQATVSSGSVTLQSSSGDIAGPYSGTLTSIISNLATHTSWFSSVVLNNNFKMNGAGTATVAEGTDLPNWTSSPIQRGVNGTSISIPIVFSGYDPAPSTYDCGFYSLSGNPYFATNFASVVGTFLYIEDAASYLSYLALNRNPKKNSFIENNEFRGLYYTNEYDSWLQAAEGTTWSTESGSSVHTRSYTVPGLTSISEEYTLLFNECYKTGEPPDPEYGDALCDNSDTNGPALDCPSNETWLNVYGYVLTPAFIGIFDCDGNNECPCPPPGPGPAPQTDCCVCGVGATSSSQFITKTPQATQTLSGYWYLT